MSRSTSPSPSTFDPDRFAPPREEDRRSPYALVTFGGGQRLCIGVNFANIEVKAIAVDVLRKYELTPVETEPPLDMGFITVMVPGGMPMRVRPHGGGDSVGMMHFPISHWFTARYVRTRSRCTILGVDVCVEAHQATRSFSHMGGMRNGHVACNVAAWR